MLKFIEKWRRDRVRDKVLANGKKLRKLQVARAGVDPAYWPHDVEWLDNEITRAERRHERLLDKLRQPQEA